MSSALDHSTTSAPYIYIHVRLKIKPNSVRIRFLSCQMFVLPPTGFELTLLIHCSSNRLALCPAPTSTTSAPYIYVFNQFIYYVIVAVVDFVVNHVGSLVPLNIIFQMNQDVYQLAIRIVATFIIVLVLNCTVIDFQEMFTISEYLSLLPF